MSERCLVCREVAGEIDPAGGLLWNDAEVIGFHVLPTDVNPRPYLGHSMVVTRRHVDHLADLTDRETMSVARASRALAGALRAEGVDRVHVALIGLRGDHFHQHLYPRYPGVPAGTAWMAVDEPPDAPHGGTDEISEFVDRLRADL